MPILFSPGQVVTQPDWEALVQQHGGDKPPVKRAPTKAEADAATEAIKVAAPLGENEDRDPNDPRVHYIGYAKNPIFRVYTNDGSMVEYRTAPNGVDYQIVDYQPSATFKQAETKAAALAARTPEEQRTQAATATATEATAAEKTAEANERAWHTAQGHGSYTHKEWDAEVSRRAKETQATAPKAGPAYKNEQGQWVQPITDAQGNVTGTQPVPAGAAPREESKPVAAPPTQKWITERKPDGTITSSLNPNYKPPSQITKDPETGQYVEITEDAEGKPIVRPVTNQTTIKPADLPVLQAKYSEISQGLGTLAADLNGRFSRGEITEKQRTDAFTAAHQQAATQISEINSILETSRAAWGQEIQQRGQTLADTQGRRAFAGDVLQNALSTGNQIALSAGPGHGAAIAGGVSALMNIGQRYAEGMGGFKESPEIAMPTSVRQAQGVGLPGFPMPAGVPPMAAPAPGAPAPAGVGAGLGASDTTDAGGAPRVMTPSSATNAPQGSIPQAAVPGMNPMVSQMAQQLQGGGAFSGSPVAAGGMGVYDPLAEAQRMLATRASGQSDPSWEEAVRRASQDAASRSGGAPGGGAAGYQRFMS